MDAKKKKKLWSRGIQILATLCLLLGNFTSLSQLENVDADTNGAAVSLTEISGLTNNKAKPNSTLKFQLNNLSNQKNGVSVHLPGSLKFDENQTKSLLAQVENENVSVSKNVNENNSIVTSLTTSKMVIKYNENSQNVSFKWLDSAKNSSSTTNSSSSEVSFGPLYGVFAVTTSASQAMVTLTPKANGIAGTSFSFSVGATAIESSKASSSGSSSSSSSSSNSSSNTNSSSSSVVKNSGSSSSQNSSQNVSSSKEQTSTENTNTDTTQTTDDTETGNTDGQVATTIEGNHPLNTGNIDTTLTETNQVAEQEVNEADTKQARTTSEITNSVGTANKPFSTNAAVNKLVQDPSTVIAKQSASFYALMDATAVSASSYTVKVVGPDGTTPVSGAKLVLGYHVQDGSSTSKANNFSTVLTTNDSGTTTFDPTSSSNGNTSGYTNYYTGSPNDTFTVIDGSVAYLPPLNLNSIGLTFGTDRKMVLQTSGVNAATKAYLDANFNTASHQIDNTPASISSDGRTLTIRLYAAPKVQVINGATGEGIPNVGFKFEGTVNTSTISYASGFTANTGVAGSFGVTGTDGMADTEWTSVATNTYSGINLNGALTAAGLSNDYIPLSDRYRFQFNSDGTVSLYKVGTYTQPGTALSIVDSAGNTVTSGEILRITIYETIHINKIDKDSSAGLANSAFTLTDTTPDSGYTGTSATGDTVATDSSGATSIVPPGVNTSTNSDASITKVHTYKLVEKTAPTGYALNKNTYYFKYSLKAGVTGVSSDGSTYSTSATPDGILTVKSGKLQFADQSSTQIKAVDTSGNPIQGINFTLSNGSKSKTYTTDNGGVAVTPTATLPSGSSSASYTLTTDASTAGYTNNAPYTVAYSTGYKSVTTGDTLIKVDGNGGLVVTLVRQYVKVVDVTTGQPISGGVYRVTVMSGTTSLGSYETATLPTSGQDLLTNMATKTNAKITPGQVYTIQIQELTTPTGYTPNKDPYKLYYSTDKGFSGNSDGSATDYMNSDNKLGTSGGNVTYYYTALASTTDPIDPDDPSLPGGTNNPGTGSKGLLTLDNVPANLNFGDQEIDYTKDNEYNFNTSTDQNDSSIAQYTDPSTGLPTNTLTSVANATGSNKNKVFTQVTDHRSGNQNWKVTVEGTALSTADNSTIDGAELIFNGLAQKLDSTGKSWTTTGINMTSGKTILNLGGGSQDLMTATNSTSGTYQDAFSTEGIKLKIPSGSESIKPDTGYKSDVTWTLTDGPA
ncbi:WxL domain-containing protein [Pediococcus ethanolidurans]|uniref:WxL domain surface cell wall-binding n=1 Tax=Pediococcus ethanolidurans TaxID=319653 RepID=A0A0R2K6U2_9LACO|nr:WxL domain-containing protein [Pediococcus ethanolidurans]KRN83029.1 hypothetical protein IV87_GL001739 [Pediococcus ethanolidurans]GEN94181.1 cell surface protein [Pediococcus ethanolidurans]SER07830.1 WxL domain surface cell wall-binding [Pediococcus ethanolidurans]